MQQFLVVMKPKLAYIAQLRTYYMVVEAADVHAARYAAELADHTVFNSLDMRYVKLAVYPLENAKTQVL